MPPFLVNLIKEKNYWQRRYNRSKADYCKENLYILKEAVKFKLYEFSNNKLKKFVESLGKAPLGTQLLWKRINRLRGQKLYSIPTLIVDGIEIEDDEDKARAFANRLRNTFDNNNTTDFDNDNVELITTYKTKKYQELYRDKEVKKIKLKELNIILKKKQQQMHL